MLHLEIYGRIPAKKNSRVKYGVTSKEHRSWHKKQSLELLKYKNRMMDNCTMQLEFWMPDNRRADLDNKLTSILDLLKDLRIIKDDCWQCVPSIYIRCCGIDKKNPRVFIWIITL